MISVQGDTFSRSPITINPLNYCRRVDSVHRSCRNIQETTATQIHCISCVQHVSRQPFCLSPCSPCWRWCPPACATSPPRLSARFALWLSAPPWRTPRTWASGLAPALTAYSASTRMSARYLWSCISRDSPSRTHPLDS